MPKYRLNYFPLKGRAEPIRYILHQAGVPFEDNRFAREQWPELKPGFVFGQVPTLEVDGKQLAQSMSIARYLANEFGLAGENNWDKAIADMYVDGLNDMLVHAKPLAMAIMGGAEDDKIKKAFQEFADGALKDFLDRYEKFLGENGSGHFVGNALTWADLVIAQSIDGFANHDASILNNYPLMKKHHAMVHNLPHIKKYVSTRPITPL